MTSFTITDTYLESIKDQVVLVTGASSGIGLATVKRLLQHGAKVYACDLNPLPEPENSTVPFSKVDVTSWDEQLAAFKAAKEKYGNIDHVFANAGTRPLCTLLEDDVDEKGDPAPPTLRTIQVNLIGCLYTVKLGLHYIKQNPKGGSIVMTGSASSFARFPATDYAAAKHGVLGLIRSLSKNLQPTLSPPSTQPIRINGVAPGWTATNIMPPALRGVLGDDIQSPDVVARSVLVLMADQKRHGELVYSDRGRYWDIENGERGVHRYISEAVGVDVEEELDFMGKLRAVGKAGKGIP